MSYNPFFEFFFQTLDLLYKNLHVQHSNLESILQKLYETKLEQGRKITIPLTIGNSTEFSYIIPKPNEVLIQSSLYLCPTLFSALSLPVLYEIICNVLVEKSILFQSNDIHLVTSSM